MQRNLWGKKSSNSDDVWIRIHTYLHVLNIMYGLCSDRLIINYVTTYRQSTYISTKYLEPSGFRARSNAPGNSSAFRFGRVISVRARAHQHGRTPWLEEKCLVAASAEHAGDKG